ncbi:hypothetical protein ACFY9G_40580 [Streptomyces anthocyanicus]|uniref:Uncharacterized protein n=1 Tax=Streptomyces violaceolatus TaxID=67378 RepID=A0ABN3THI5_9ACTN|nr:MULTISPECIES: hypothetical protein [Streptomyces]MDX3351716.1 hypothetical protein [Streptomyces sp. ME02-6979A]
MTPVSDARIPVTSTTQPTANRFICHWPAAGSGDLPHISGRSESERLLKVFGDVLAAVREAAESADTASAPNSEKDTGTATIDAPGSGTVDGAGEPAV